MMEEVVRYTIDMHNDRKLSMRRDLYRAIYAGDMEAAEDAANLMAMVDIDREVIEQARREVRVLRPAR